MPSITLRSFIMIGGQPRGSDVTLIQQIIAAAATTTTGAHKQHTKLIKHWD